jgi:hypothetical protein
MLDERGHLLERFDFTAFDLPTDTLPSLLAETGLVVPSAPRSTGMSKPSRSSPSSVGPRLGR